jgi:hypothetical protein
MGGNAHQQWCSNKSRADGQKLSLTQLSQAVLFCGVQMSMVHLNYLLSL